MRKLIARWLFGTDIDSYFDLLIKNREYLREKAVLINDHIKTLEREKETINILKKAITVLNNHNIDLKEIDQVETVI